MHALQVTILAMWQPDEDSGIFRNNECVIRYLSSGDTSICVCR